MDASELKPAFNFDRAIALMAGGMEAFFNAREASEGDEEKGAEDIRSVNYPQLSQGASWFIPPLLRASPQALPHVP